MMTIGPEAKAAEAWHARKCQECEHLKKDIACKMICFQEEAIKANSAHYLPLLRKFQRTHSAYKIGNHGADCMCCSCQVNREIDRLEKGSA